ncbi:MAG: peptidylprolyl isomerase [Bacteroidales bacterium]|jgi:cyclophilin family peptidyl-prolyl cis-trans isomerase|nr:peptidylprolyl isomerase [Bacteroidales bacterium]
MQRTFLLIAVILLSINSYSQKNEETKQDDYLIIINTSYGKIKLLLFDDCPEHKSNFIKLAKAGVYNHIIFHRVINNFMIQTGDYTTRNKPINFSPTIINSTIVSEVSSKHKHIRGAIGAARKGVEQNPQKRSSGTQFYIIQNCNGAHHLDEGYTVFGHVVSGMEVVDEIAALPTNKHDRLIEELRITMDVMEISKDEIEKFYYLDY